MDEAGDDVDPQLQMAIQRQRLMLEQQRHEELLRIQQTVVERQYETNEPDDLFAMQPPPGLTSGPRGPPGMESGPRGEPALPALMSLKLEAPPRHAPAQGGAGDGIDADVVRLPMALEQALAFKTERAKQLGVDGDESDADRRDAPMEGGADDAEPEEEDEAAEPAVSSRRAANADERQNKNRKKKQKRRRAKERQRLAPPTPVPADDETGEKPDATQDIAVDIEYVAETLSFAELEPMYRQFARVFDAFRAPPPEEELAAAAVAAPELPRPADLKKVPKPSDDYEDDDDDEKKEGEADKPRLSKRKLKKLTRLSVAELKQLVTRPDVVEMHDVTARDPKLLVQLKAHRNTVPVPRHWCFKRKYLQGKRGIEKPPFDLPEFIKKTGIMEMRAALQEKEDQRTLKAKMRERARPKLGKIDIDYQKLHDAFFKWQTKPRMSIHGDLYYEGKEFETRLKEKKPGDLTEDLRTALGMPVGHSAHKVPPPWLIAMQRYGPPPSYPNLKIPGLNAPIPESCSFGYHAGGWGKPPVDETGRPLYGDVFGITGQHAQAAADEEEVDRAAWGELESESESESEEEEEDDEEGGAPEGDESGLVTPAEGLVTPSGITSMPAGMETPEVIELRKRKIETDMEGGEAPALYQVLAEKRVDRLGGAMMASTHIYDMTGAGGPQLPAAQLAPPRRGPGEGTVELALDPSELDLDNEAMAARYEQQIREQQSGLQKEDLSDMLADHVARQKNKRKQRQQHQDSKQAKKYKEFKF